jgi:hypothetical protein
MAALFPDVGPRARAVEVARSGARLEVLVDAHVLVRVVDALAAGEGDPWRVVAQNRARVRARVRIVAAQHHRAALGEALLGLDGLAARTHAAVARWAWAWAWHELGHDFPFDVEAVAARPCLTEGEAPLLSDADRAALRTWVLLVALRGRLDHLRRWAARGGTGDRDSTWGRLLAEELPPGLAARGYGEVRAVLVEELDDLLVGLRGRLEAVASAPGGRGLRGAISARLAPEWSGEVRFPGSGFPRMRRAAADALATLEPR